MLALLTIAYLGTLLKAVLLVGHARVRRPGEGRLSLWLAVLLGGDLNMMAALHWAGFASRWYAWAFYGGDLLIALTGFWLLAGLAERVAAGLGRPGVRRPNGTDLLRWASIAILLGLALASWRATDAASPRRWLEFAFDWEQNACVAGMLASLLLWVGCNLARLADLRLRRILLGASIFFTFNATNRPLVQVLPASPFVLTYFLPLASGLVLLALAFCVLGHPGEAELRGERGAQCAPSAAVANGEGRLPALSKLSS